MGKEIGTLTDGGFQKFFTTPELVPPRAFLATSLLVPMA
jgi:hypothetical protein